MLDLVFLKVDAVHLRDHLTDPHIHKVETTVCRKCDLRTLPDHRIFAWENWSSRVSFYALVDSPFYHWLPRCEDAESFMNVGVRILEVKYLNVC